MTSGDSIVVGPLGPFSGAGGGGSTSFGSVPKLTSKMTSRSFSVMDTAETVEISYNWTSYDSEDESATGNGTASWYVGGIRVAMHTVAQGDNKFDVKPYLSVGTANTVKLTIEDSYGTTKSVTWSVTVSSYGLTWNVVEMALHGTSALGLRLVPNGDGDKIIHITVDGTEKCGETVATTGRTLTVGSIGYDIAPITSGLVIDLDPTGHSNTEAGRSNFGYKDGDDTVHPLTFSDNFDWDNGGFRADEDGVTAFVVRRGTYVEFDRSLFNDNAGTLGKEIKIVFKSMNVRSYDAELLRCKAGNVGIVLQAQQATLTSELTTIVSPYCEERKIEMNIY